MQRALLMHALAACTHAGTAAAPTPPHMAWGLVLHGGAGVITRDKLTPEREAAIRADLERALKAAHAVLSRGGTSVAAVRTIKIPILLAKAVMDYGRHVMLMGTGAEDFAATAGIEKVDPAYFR